MVLIVHWRGCLYKVLFIVQVLRHQVSPDFGPPNPPSESALSVKALTPSPLICWCNTWKEGELLDDLCNTFQTIKICFSIIINDIKYFTVIVLLRLTLSPTAYQILWVPRGGATMAPPLNLIEGAIFERGHGNRKWSLCKFRHARQFSEHFMRACMHSSI